jgi:TonB family protein
VTIRVLVWFPLAATLLLAWTVPAVQALPNKILSENTVSSQKAEPAPPENAPQPRTTKRSTIGGSGLLERRRTRRSNSSSLGGLSSCITGSGPGEVGNSDVFNPDRDGPGEGIDTSQEVDFGPYMAELQRRVKRNWIPPDAGNSQRSVLRFSVSRAGEVCNLRLGKTSGNPDSDAAAMDAVHRSTPFRTLPAGYKGQNIDIQFTFDINVFDGDVDDENKGPTESAVDRPAYDHSKSYKSSD